MTALLLLAGMTGFLNLYHFLAAGKRIDAQVLVVEGWLPRWALRQVIREYQTNPYELLVTTGGLYTERDYLMCCDGPLSFDMSLPGLQRDSLQKQELIVVARGIPVLEEQAHFSVRVNQTVLGGAFVADSLKEYVFPLDSLPPHEAITQITVLYDNDEFISYTQDRSLLVHAVKLDSHVFSPYTDLATYHYEWMGEPIQLVKGPNFAYGAAHTLSQLGIPDSVIVQVPAVNAYTHRTPESAASFHEWIQKTDISLSTINIFTTETHARRTLRIYQDELSEEPIEIGMISISAPQFNRKNWWRSEPGIMTVMKEFAKYVWEVWLGLRQ